MNLPWLVTCSASLPFKGLVGGGASGCPRLREWKPMKRMLIATVLIAGFLASMAVAKDYVAQRSAAAAATDFSIAGGKSSTVVPFALVDNRIFVKVKLNGKGPFNFILDTGADAVVRPELARDLGLHSEINGEGFGAGEKPVLTGTTHVAQIQIGDVRIDDEPFSVMSFADTPHVFGSVPVDGVIGRPVFERLVVAIDYERHLVTLTLPQRFQYHGTGTVVAFERRSDRNLPIIQGELDGVVGKFGIDTGTRSAVLLYGPFIEGNHLRAKYAPKVEGITGWGFGGPVRSQVARAQSLKLGPVEAHNLVVRLSLQRSGALTSTALAGLVGPDVLDQFNVVFDYSRRHIIFEKNSQYGIPDTYDRSGMWLGQDGKYFEVMDLTPGGPAAQAGLRVGDRILAIDGRSTDKLLLPDVRLQLRQAPPSKQLKLWVRSPRGQRTVVLTLRDLV